MKFALPVGLLAVFALAGCEVDQPPPHHTRPVAKYPQAQQYPPPQQPFQEGGVPPENPTAAAPENAPPQETTATGRTTTPTAEKTQAAAKGDYPYGVPVPGKPGFVRSPYSPDKMTDVRGYAPGTEVKDPYTNKIFLVP